MGIIVCTESGQTAKQICKFRPGMPVIALTTSTHVARFCNGCLKGCSAKILPSLDHTEAVVRETLDEQKKRGCVKDAEPVVVVHGMTRRTGATNTMKIEYA